ncbi:MAG: Gfo/Idh/MocA family oxidoreductase [Anaerolineae bacterium]|nr:Gfo/Idh/MocA family oxidoreductase [Anaerolineae bacterium]
MTKFRAGIIGCGVRRREDGSTGFGQGHVHALGYEATDDVELVAAADIKQENLDCFCDQHRIPGRYLDYKEMLARERLDIVSICVWPHLHAPMTIDAARARVKAIHCEKPMAPTWGEARAMVRVCDELGVQLTLNHQRRFGAPFRAAKKLLDDGAIGRLERLEAFTSNMYDWGTHWFDMLFMYNDETPVEWVIAQIEARGGRSIFGVAIEGQGISQFRYRNGVYGLMQTGNGHEAICANRLIGSDGVIEVGVQDGPYVRYRNLATGGQWVAVEMEEGLHGSGAVVDGVLDLIDALKSGREPALSARKALQATELIFATYESSRKRGRVDLPLQIEDSPFLSMLQSGQISIED